MVYLFRVWNDLKKLLDKNIILFLDYDGTLTPIVETPDKAILSRQGRELLEKLSQNPRIKLTIISGRVLKDIKKMVGIENIIYAGNHGLELSGPEIKFQSPISKRYMRILERIKEDLNKEIASIKGAFVENKGLSLSLHYRLVNKKDRPTVEATFHKTIISYLVRNKIKIKSGKKVLEVRPPVDWDKAKIVLWLLKKYKKFPVYIGDDITDEDAFKALKNRGLTIFVGRPKKSSYAEYYLKNSREVLKFLLKIKKV